MLAEVLIIRILGSLAFRVQAADHRWVEALNGNWQGSDRKWQTIQRHYAMIL
ncbi:MAG: hypothetical protein ACTS2F_16645 [Thainema sp.]